MSGSNTGALMPYNNNCPCDSRWLSGFLWGRGLKQGTYKVVVTISSRPRPIIAKLRSLLEEEEFESEDRIAGSGSGNSDIITISHPEVRAWRMPKASRRRLGISVSDEFIQGFFASKLTVHTDGLCMAGKNWFDDVKNIVTDSGCEIRCYRNQLVIPRSEIHKTLLAEFSSALDSERQAFAEFSRENVAIVDSLDEEDTLKRMGDYSDVWEDDWTAGLLLSLGIESFDPVVVVRERFYSDAAERRFIESVKSKDMWHRVTSDTIELSLESSLVDWLKTSSIEHTRLGREAMAGAISRYAKDRKGTGILLSDEWSVKTLPSWLKNRLQPLQLRLKQTAEGPLLLHINEDSPNVVIAALQDLLSHSCTELRPGADAVRYVRAGPSVRRQDATRGLHSDVDHSQSSTHPQADLAYRVGTILSTEGPIRLSRLYERISAEYNASLQEHTLLKQVNAIIKDAYYSNGDFAAFSERQYWDAVPRIPTRREKARAVEDMSVPELAHVLTAVRSNSHGLDEEALIDKAAEMLFLDPRQPMVRMRLTNAMEFVRAVEGTREEAIRPTPAGTRDSTLAVALSCEETLDTVENELIFKEHIRHTPEIGNLRIEDLPTATIWHLAGKAKRADILSYGEVKALKEYARSKYLLQGAAESEIVAATASLRTAISRGLLDIPCTKKKKPCFRCKALKSRLTR